jgi:hypothetical protein
VLLDHSLMVVLEPVAGEPRYGMLELVREYALDRLREAGEEAEMRRRHAAYLLELVDAVGPKVGGPESRTALNLLEAELPNIRAAFAWAGGVGEHDLALRLASVLMPLWLNLRHRAEGRAVLQAALSRPGAGLPIARARALNALGRLNWRDADRWPRRARYSRRAWRSSARWATWMAAPKCSAIWHSLHCCRATSSGRQCSKLRACGTLALPGTRVAPLGRYRT